MNTVSAFSKLSQCCWRRGLCAWKPPRSIRNVRVRHQRLGWDVRITCVTMPSA